MAALILPRTSAVRWWAVPVAVVLLAGAGAFSFWRHQNLAWRGRWSTAIACGQIFVAHSGFGFAGVAFGGTEGNQRFLLLVVLVLTASTSDGHAAAFSVASGAFTAWWSAYLAGLSAGVSFTVAILFAVSAIPIASIVHTMLTNQSAQARLAAATASFASATARGDTLDDLHTVLPLASAVLGGPPLQLLRINEDRETARLAAFERSGAQRRLLSRLGSGRDSRVEEQFVAATRPGEAYVLVVTWPNSAARRAVPLSTVEAVRDLLGHLIERSLRITVLEHSTMTDPLTGLGNRRQLFERMQSRSADCTVAIFDLDHFKQFNDTFGHLEGDALLKRFSSTLQTHRRDGDCAARLGGEEFCVMLNRTDARAAREFVERVRTAFRADPGNVTFSAGVAVVRGPDTLEDVLNRADQALYEAKRSGRDRTVFASN